MKRIKFLLLAICLVAACGVALPAYNIALLQPAMLGVLIRGSEADTIRIANYLADRARTAGDSRSQGNYFADLAHRAAQLREQFGLVRVRVLNRDGKVSFSSIAEEVGSRPLNDHDLAKARSGKAVSHSAELAGTNGGKKSEVISSLVPLNLPGGTFDLLEVSYDVTERKQALRSLVNRSAAFLAATAFVLVTVIAWLTARTKSVFDRNDTLRQHLQSKRKQLQAVLTAIPAPIFFKDHRGVYLGCNRAFETCLGLPREKIIGASVWDVAPKDLADQYHQADCDLMARGGHQVYETEVRYADGSLHQVMFHKAVIHATDGRPDGLVGVMLDITERKQAEREVAALAYQDTLTGLANRSLFKQRLADALVDAQQSEQHLALLFLDLDRFKYINDTLGHASGDQLLQQVAGRLNAMLPVGGTLARLGGDEFVIMLTEVATTAEVENFARNLLRTLEPSFTLAGKQLHVSTSIGIALYPEHGHQSGALLKHADMAMYAAKEQGRNSYCVYRRSMGQKALQRRDLETRLRQALENEEFALVYQPQIDYLNGQVRGVEALLRWHHPRRGLVYPTEFIPIAEETGLIRSIGEWVLREACRQLGAWHLAGFPGLRMAVNISGQQFRQPDFLEMVDRSLQEACFDPTRLELEMEMTETVLLDNVEVTRCNLEGLKKRGISLAIDDFGTGYSSLSYLKDFPIDRIKIDRSFVGEISHDGHADAIVDTIIAMARSLQVQIIAEGVETEQQVRFLEARRCFDMQGFYFARPMPAPVLERYLSRANKLQVPSTTTGITQKPAAVCPC